MQDPTTFEGIFPTLEEKINKGIGEEDIVTAIKEELQKASSEGRLKSAISPSYFIMTINMNGKVSAGAGTAEKRRTLLNVILRCFPSSIIFCQELPGHFEKNVLPKGYDFVKKENEAAVIWNEDEFDASKMELKSTALIKIRDETEGASELLSRTAMVKLTHKHQHTDAKTKTIAAVSYHGRYKVGEVTRIQFFHGLLNFLFKVQKTKEHCDIDSFIIGGDFNMDTLEVPDLPENAVVPSYESSPRQEQASKAIPHKDNFVYYPHGNLTLSWTRPFLLEDDKTPDSDINAEDHDSTQTQLEDTTRSGSRPAKTTDMLDHDPVVAVLRLEFPPQSKAVKNLTQKLHEVSVSE